MLTEWLDTGSYYKKNDHTRLICGLYGCSMWPEALVSFHSVRPAPLTQVIVSTWQNIKLWKRNKPQDVISVFQLKRRKCWVFCLNTWSFTCQNTQQRHPGSGWGTKCTRHVSNPATKTHFKAFISKLTSTITPLGVNIHKNPRRWWQFLDLTWKYWHDVSSGKAPVNFYTHFFPI